MAKEEITQDHLLSRYRALDLTDEKGMMCGKILADMGMDVIKLEPPGGDPARNIGPFYHGTPDPEKSLFWFFLNLNKRGITLNLDTEDGRQIFKRLAQKVDLIIESFPVGFLGRLGLSYSDLSQVNRQIILTSITGFGQTGPYKDFKAPDLVVMAMGGEMNLTGDPDRPPLRIGVPAGVVATAEDLHQDPQLAHRKHYQKLKHPVIGLHSYEAPAFQFSRTPVVLERPAPCLGEHSRTICTEILGMKEEEFQTLEKAAVFR